MSLIRALAIYLYVMFVVVTAVPYFNWLEKRTEKIGADVVKQKIHAHANMMAKGVMRLTGSKITVNGAEHLPSDETVLYVANHQSYMDIPVLMTILDRSVGFIAKDDMGKIPFFKKWIVHMKCVLITRGDTRKALTAIIQASKLLQQGHSLILYPEGTRSKDGMLQEFKAGSLKAAQKGKVPIVPIAIDGARDIMPRGSFLIYKRDVTVTVFPMIPAEQVQQMDTKELAAQIKEQIAGALGQEVTEKAGAQQDE